MKKIVSLFLALAMIFAVVPVMAADNYYTVSDLAFTDFDGKVIENPDASCIVRAMVTKNIARTDVDSVVMVAYSTDGKLISFNVLKGTMVTGADSEFSALVNIPDGKELGFVKVSVWDSITNMNALSNVSRLDVNETAEPESGSIMPDTVTVYAMITENSATSGGNISENQARIVIDSLEYDYSDCTTYEEVRAKKEYYDIMYDSYGLYAGNNTATAAMAILVKTTPECGNILPNVLGKATLKIDKDHYGMHELTKFTYLDANNIVTYDNSLFDDSNYHYSENMPGSYFRYYPAADAEKSEKCKLNSYVNLYVNGLYMPSTQMNFDMYVINNRAGNITFVDMATADGYYDCIYVDYYETGIVDSVDEENGEITFKDRGNCIIIDDEVLLNIYLDGEEITLADIKEDDVLSIKCEPGNMMFSMYYDIYVSRDVKTGICNAIDPAEGTITIGEETYKTWFDVQTGSEYKIYLDVFGRVCGCEAVASSVNYAILDKYTKLSSDNYYRATLYTTEGVGKALEVDTNKVAGPNGEDTDIDNAWANVVYSSGTYKTPVQNRVVKYEVSVSTGRITYMELVAPTASTYYDDFNAMAKYEEATQSIGSVCMDEDTKIVDAIEYEKLRARGQGCSYADLSLGYQDGFTNGSKYEAWAFGDANSNGAYPFVIVTNGSVYSTKTELSIVTEYAGLGVNENNEEVYKFTALYNGEETEFAASDDAEVYGFDTGTTIDTTNLLSKGDVIVIVPDQDGTVKEITRVVSANALGVDTGYDAVWTKAMTNSVIENVFLPDATWSTDWDNTTSATVLSYGPVIEKTNDYIRIGNVQTGSEFTDSSDNIVTDETFYTDIASDYKEIIFDDDTIVYTWDYNYSKNTQLCDSNAGTGSIVPTMIGDAALYNNGTVLPYGTTDGVKNENATTNFALVKSVDGYATEVFMIIAK